MDLIKADTPHTTAKISRMLHQLEFKLQVEMQYKKGIDKMAKLYQADGDKKSKADAESKRVESERKIALLQTALKRYKTLHILDDAEEDEPREPEPRARQPFRGGPAPPEAVLGAQLGELREPADEPQSERELVVWRGAVQRGDGPDGPRDGDGP